MSSALGAGKEVVSYCGSCKLSLGHVIVAMEDSQTISKVTCNTCGATHKYKDPATAKKKTRKKRTTKKKQPDLPISEIWMQKMSKTKNKSKNYSIRETFELGDIIDHVKFGPGIVEAIVDNDKIEVMFRHQVRTLVHNK